jgi:hypothetical protein
LIKMKEMTKNFLNLFFNPGEEICFSPNKYAIPSKPQEEIDEENTVLVAINPIKGQRNDENVTAYRTFMVECDDGNLASQYKYIKDSGFPYSYCCFSGNKSLHFALVLDHEIPSSHIYRHTYQWILNILAQADQKTKNPSRSIRFPGVIREETGKEQKLLHIKKRISLDELGDWLNKHVEKKPVALTNNRGRSAKPNWKGIKKWARDNLEEGIHNLEGSRNQKWMAIGCEWALNGYDLERTIHLLQIYFQEQSDFKEKEWLTAVKSGWNYANKIVRSNE